MDYTVSWIWEDNYAANDTETTIGYIYKLTNGMANHTV